MRANRPAAPWETSKTGSAAFSKPNLINMKPDAKAARTSPASGCPKRVPATCMDFRRSKIAAAMGSGTSQPSAGTGWQHRIKAARRVAQTTGNRTPSVSPSHEWTCRCCDPNCYVRPVCRSWPNNESAFGPLIVSFGETTKARRGWRSRSGIFNVPCLAISRHRSTSSFFRASGSFAGKIAFPSDWSARFCARFAGSDGAGCTGSNPTPGRTVRQSGTSPGKLGSAGKCH